MPLIKGRSNKTRQKNIETEMEANPAPEDRKQNLAIAYSVQKQARKKKKMALGGAVDSTPKTAVSTHEDEMELTPDEKKMKMEQDAESLDGPRTMQSNSAVSEFEDEDDLHREESRAQREESAESNDGGRTKQSEDMSSEHEGMKEADIHHSDEEEHEDSFHAADIDRFADGGEVDEDDAGNPKLQQSKMSVADAVMSRRKQKMYAEGGEVDLDRNAQEDENMEDDMSFDALRKENYSEEPALEDLTSPKDSNEHGRTLLDADSHDMIDELRRRIKAKRGM